jgi:hypothetical protein
VGVVVVAADFLLSYFAAALCNPAQGRFFIDY